MVLKNRVCLSVNVANTILCNILLHCDTTEVIYGYTQDVYHCITDTHAYMHVCNTIYVEAYKFHIKMQKLFIHYYVVINFCLL